MVQLQVYHSFMCALRRCSMNGKHVCSWFPWWPQRLRNESEQACRLCPRVRRKSLISQNPSQEASQWPFDPISACFESPGFPRPAAFPLGPLKALLTCPHLFPGYFWGLFRRANRDRDDTRRRLSIGGTREVISSKKCWLSFGEIILFNATFDQGNDRSSERKWFILTIIASLNCAWKLLRGTSFGTFWNGASNSRATSCRPEKHITVNPFRMNPNTSFVRYVSMRIGMNTMITKTKRVVSWEWGSGNGV